MPDASTIPFKQADPNGHYRSKQLPYDKADFLAMLQLPPFPGDVVGPASSTAGQIAVFSSGTGKAISNFTGSGLVTAASGVAGVTPAPVGQLVGTTDVQTLTNKTLVNPVISGLTGLTKADVGLGNVDNTSDATKNSAVATLTNKTLTSPVINSPTGLVKADVGLGNVDNTSDANKPVSTAQATALALKEDKANKAMANGYAWLDGSVKMPLSQIPDSVIGASQYQGTWNASTNTPTIPAAAVGNKGWYYSVSVAGTTNINGINSWAVGDQVISNGAAWQKIPNVESVTSVAGKTGIVTLVKADVGLGSVDNTSDAAKPVSTAQQTALNLKQDTAGKGVANGYAGLDSGGKVPLAQLPPIPAGDVIGPATSVTGELATYADTTGKLLGRLTPPAGALVGTNATQTLASKTLTNPTINGAAFSGTVTGLAKGDVGLANVDNTSDATKNAASATLTNKTINGANNTLTVRLDADVVNNLPVNKLNSGTGANSGSFWRGDGQWAPPAGGGDVVGPAGSADGELPLFNGTTGKIVKRCNLSGFVKAVANGAATAQAKITTADYTALSVDTAALADGAVTAPKLAAAAIHSQTLKSTWDPTDELLLWDNVTSQLRRVTVISTIKEDALPRGYLAGGILSNNVADATNDIDVAAGICRDDTNSANITIPLVTKRLDAAWVAGTNQGGRDTGAISDGCWHVFAILNPSTGVADVLLSLSFASPVMPSGFTLKRRIGSVIRLSGSIRQQIAVGDYVHYTTLIYEPNGSAISVGQTYSNNFSLSVPSGLRIVCNIQVVLTTAGGAGVMGIRAMDITNGMQTIATAVAGVQTCTSGSIVSAASNAGYNAHYMTGAGAATFSVVVQGYWDQRGKDL